MSLFAASLAGEIRAARAVLRAAAPGSAAALAAALNHAEDCLADLERAEALLDSERASAEAARAALDRALQLAEIKAEQRRRADEAAAPALDREAEVARLQKTIALAAEAIREADTLRSTAQPGEEIEDTRRRWEDAGCIEMAAVACRKAARKALASLTVFADKRSPAQQAAAIEATRPAALSLKAAIDHYRERDQRLRASKKGGAK